MVVLFHGELLVANWYGVKPEYGVYSFGFSGVHLFFVISGLIIFYVHHNDFDNYKNILFYLSRRIIRIYPLYWILFLVWGGWRIFAGKFPVDDFIHNALLFVPRNQPLTLQVAWTLAHEMLFYLLFLSFLISRKAGLILFMGWGVLLVSNYFLEFSNLVPLKLPNLLFFFGLTSGFALLWIKRNLTASAHDYLAYSSLVVGAAFFVVTVRYCSELMSKQTETITVTFEVWNNMPLLLGFGLASAFLLLSGISARVENFIKKRKFLLAMGNASYSIYLMHLKMQRIIVDNTRSFDWLWGDKTQAKAYVLLTIVMFFSLLSGVLVHKLIEKPVLTGCGKLLARANVKRFPKKLQSF